MFLGLFSVICYLLEAILKGKYKLVLIFYFLGHPKQMVVVGIMFERKIAVWGLLFIFVGVLDIMCSDRLLILETRIREYVQIIPSLILALGNVFKISPHLILALGSMSKIIPNLLLAFQIHSNSCLRNFWL